jgi:hypothetical protein
VKSAIKALNILKAVIGGAMPNFTCVDVKRRYFKLQDVTKDVEHKQRGFSKESFTMKPLRRNNKLHL